MRFFTTFIKELIEAGDVVDIATNEDGGEVPSCYRDWDCKIMHISCTRSPLDKRNLQAIKEIKEIIKNGHYDIVHCHTPIAAACTRIACKGLRKKGLKVIYTAHGFHFYKGAPLKNWLLYYPVEKLCSHWTDVLITINKEDYSLAQKKMKAKKVVYVPGVGIDTKRFSQELYTKEEIIEFRKELGITENEKMFLSVGELSDRKNHEVVIRALSNLNRRDFKYFIAGEGVLESKLNSLILELHLEKNIRLLGYRKDISKLCDASDLFIFPSKQEGLPVALMEAIASKTPVICSSIRGNTELVNDNQLFDSESVEQIQNKILEFYDNGFIEETKADYKKLRNFDLTVVNSQMNKIYNNMFNEGGDSFQFINRVNEINKERTEIGIPNNAFIILSVGELNTNKNHQIIIKALAQISDKNIHYVIAGDGDQKDNLQRLSINLGINNQVHLLGYRNDVVKLYSASDVYALPSIREGLNVSLQEAMASGLPCIVSQIRGNVDLIEDGVNGYYMNPFDVKSVHECIERSIINNKMNDISVYADKFDIHNIDKSMKEVYECL